MKKLIIAILILLPSFAFAGMQDAHKAVIARMNVSGGTSCTTDTDSSIYDFTGLTSNNIQSGTGGQQFTTSSTYTITEYKIEISDNSGVSDATFTASLHQDNSNTISTIIANSTVTVDDDIVPDNPSYGIVTFTLDTPLTGLTAGTYWLVVTSPENTGYIYTRLDLGTSSDQIMYGNTNYSASYSTVSSVYGCEE